MNPQTKAWLIVIATALGTGCAVAGTSLAGGCKTPIAVLAGVGAAASAVYHSLSQSPTQSPSNSTTETPKP